MNKITAVVVDDELNSVKLLVHFIEKYCPNIIIVGEAYTKDDAVTLINKTRPKLLFLDIRLDIGTSFDLLNELTYKDAKFIFVTAYNEYAVRAFKYNAVDYILKPLQIEELITAVDKACEDIEKDIYTNKEQLEYLHNSMLDSRKEFKFVAVPTVKKIDFIRISDIIYLKSEGRYTFLYLVDGKKITASKNLGEYESILNPTIFFRIHRSYLVNLNFISSIFKHDGCYCEMNNEERLPVAKRRIEHLLKFINAK